MGKRAEAVRDTLAGQVFGLWTVQGEVRTENGVHKWLCACACGAERYVNEKNLLSGKSQSCGCRTANRMKQRAFDLTGQTFGELTVLERSGSKNSRAVWLCRCACGALCQVTGQKLRSGQTRHCGCRKQSGRKGADLRGRKFGLLTPVAPTEKRDRRGSVIWKCACDCGGEAEVSANGLLYGGRVSCGCRQEAALRNVHITLHFVDGTCIEFLEKRRQRNDNQSGQAGVYRMKNGMYRAQIGFQGKRYSLGTFYTYEEACKARKQAEQEYFEPFLEKNAAKQKTERNFS
ncbi:MAG: transcriptional regulator [Clostridiales bacterium]|nr:transcriptional regulator [Clostridiales bacterium]